MRESTRHSKGKGHPNLYIPISHPKPTSLPALIAHIHNGVRHKSPSAPRSQISRNPVGCRPPLWHKAGKLKLTLGTSTLPREVVVVVAVREPQRVGSLLLRLLGDSAGRHNGLSCVETGGPGSSGVGCERGGGRGGGEEVRGMIRGGRG